MVKGDRKERMWVSLPDILATASVNGQPAASAEQVRVVALDLDGTILEPGMHLAAPLVSTLQALAGSGVCCVTATGRPLDYQLELFARHGLGSAVGVPAALMADERELFLAGDCTTFGMPSRPLRSAEYRPFDEWNDAVRARWRHLHTSAMDWLERLQQEAAGRGWSAAPLLTDEVAFARGLPTLLCARAEEATALHDWLTAALAAEAGGLLTCSRNVRAGATARHPRRQGAGARRTGATVGGAAATGACHRGLVERPVDVGWPLRLSGCHCRQRRPAHRSGGPQ